MEYQRLQAEKMIMKDVKVRAIAAPHSSPPSPAVLSSTSMFNFVHSVHVSVQFCSLLGPHLLWGLQNWTPGASVYHSDRHVPPTPTIQLANKM